LLVNEKLMNEKVKKKKNPPRPRGNVQNKTQGTRASKSNVRRGVIFLDILGQKKNGCQQFAKDKGQKGVTMERNSDKKGGRPKKLDRKKEKTSVTEAQEEKGYHGKRGFRDRAFSELGYKKRGMKKERRKTTGGKKETGAPSVTGKTGKNRGNEAGGEGGF